MIVLKNSFLAIAIIIFSMSCQDKKTPIAFIKESNYQMFWGVKIEARKVESGKYIAYKFTKEFEEQDFTLPNYKYYNSNQIENDSMFDILKYGYARGMKSFSDATNTFKLYSDSIMNEFEKMNVYKIFSSKKEGCFIVFYLNSNDFIAYVPDISKIYNNFWRNKIKDSEELEPHWFLGKY